MSAIFKFKPLANFQPLPFEELNIPEENKECPICLETFDKIEPLVSHDYQGLNQTPEGISLSSKVQHVFHKSCAKRSFDSSLEEEKKPVCSLCQYAVTFESAREILDSDFAKSQLPSFAMQEFLDKFTIHIQNIISNNLPIKSGFDEEKENEMFIKFAAETLRDVHIDFLKKSPKKGNEVFCSSYLHFLTFEMLAISVVHIDSIDQLLEKHKEEILESDPSLSEESCDYENGKIKVKIRERIDYFFDKLKKIILKRKQICSLDSQSSHIRVNGESITHLVSASIVYGFMLFHLHQTNSEKEIEDFKIKALATYALGVGSIFACYVFRGAWIRRETEEEILARRISRISIT